MLTVTDRDKSPTKHPNAGKPGFDNKGRFAPGNKMSPGRKKGTRQKLTDRFLADLGAAWKARGAEVIDKAIERDPEGVLRVVASLLPKNVNLNADASESFLDALKLMQAMRKPEAEIPHPDQIQSSRVVNVVDLDPETGQPIENKEN